MGILEQVAALDDELDGRKVRRDARFQRLSERIAIDGQAVAIIGREILPDVPGQKEFLDRLLTGSQAKTAFALRMNAERMIKEDGLNCTGFLTLTVGNTGPDGKFQQVFTADEASRRINNLNRRFLPDLFKRAIIVTERHKSGAIHFHILGTLKSGANIRQGYDFAAVKSGDYRSASIELRAIWATLREKLPDYGFGRAELEPVRKTSEAVASYVSKYIAKNVCNRTADDRYKKLVRYIGWHKSQLKPNEFAWAGKKAIAWRWKARTLAGLVGISQPEEAAKCLGPRWAWKLTSLWRATTGDDLTHGFNWTHPEKEFLRGQLANENLRWMRRWDSEKRPFSMSELPDYFPMPIKTQFRQPQLN